MLDSLLAGFVAAVVSWAQPYATQHNRTLSIEQTMCLAEAEYFESRGEGSVGMTAVAYTVLNRTVSRDKTICGAIHERGQFSYYSPHHKRHPHEIALWMDATFTAVYAQLGVIDNPIDNATMFSESRMSSWLDDARFLKRINHHYFYVMRRDQGLPLLYPKPVATVPLSRMHVDCLLLDPQCDPLYRRAGLSVDSRLIDLLSSTTGQMTRMVLNETSVMTMSQSVQETYPQRRTHTSARSEHHASVGRSTRHSRKGYS